MASEYCDYTKIKLRPCVLEAAVAMELKLRKHDGKRGSSGWRRDSTVTLLKRAVQELGEAFGEVGEPHAGGLAAECVDVMNMVMMARDAALLWEEPVRLKRGERD